MSVYKELGPVYSFELKIGCGHLQENLQNYHFLSRVKKGKVA